MQHFWLIAEMYIDAVWKAFKQEGNLNTTYIQNEYVVLPYSGPYGHKCSDKSFLGVINYVF